MKGTANTAKRPEDCAPLRFFYNTKPMKTPRFTLAVSFAALALAACSSPASPDQAALLQNPLYARYYYQDQAEMMANYNLQNDPILKDSEKKGTIESVRSRALEHLKEANGRINAGRRGGFMSDTDYAAGSALLLDDKLHLGQDFNTLPGPEVYAYVSMLVDPMDGSGSVQFPDASAVNLGPLKSPYGAQSYEIPADQKGKEFRLVGLWDKRLGRLLGYAQLGQ